MNKPKQQGFMIVQDIMCEIKDGNELSRFLYQLAEKEKEEHIKDDLEEASDMIDRYVSLLAQMQITGLSVSIGGD